MKIKLGMLLMLIVATFLSSTQASATTFRPTSPQSLTAYSLSQYFKNEKGFNELRRTASGKLPEVGMVAMKPKKKGTCCDTALPFGTQIILDTPISHWYYGELSSFVVEDAGQINWQDTNLTTHWLDIWFGYSDDSRNLQAAQDFEIKHRIYTAYY
jgi:hypothetical protein